MERSRALLLAGAFAFAPGLGCSSEPADRPSAVVAAEAQPAETAPAETAPAAAAAPAPARTPERALSYVPVGEAEARIGRAQAASRAAPDSIRALDTLAALFYRRYRETGDPEHLRRAEDAIGAALDRAPEDPLALAMSGLLDLTAHRFRDARDTARRILQLDRHDTTALILLGDAQLEMGEYESAVEAYQRALDTRPDLRTYNRGAYSRWLHGDIEGSLELLQQATGSGSARDPESTAWCLVDLANLHWHRGDRPRVRMALEQAMSLVPDYAPALRLRARLEAAEGDRAAAIATLESMIAQQEHVGDLLYLVELLETEGRADDARTRLARAVTIAREDPRALASYRARHAVELPAALSSAEAELRNRGDIYTHATHALALARNGRHADARAAMDRALVLGTPDVSLYLSDALVRHLGGDQEGARAALERARVNPDVDRWLFDHLERELGTPQ